MSLASVHAVRGQVERGHGRGRWPARVGRRLALLVTGIVAARTTVLAQVAREVLALRRMRATRAESVARGLRRTVSAPRLDAQACAQTMTEVVDGSVYRQPGARLVVALDERRQDERIQLLRLALPYRGGSGPLAWAVWEHNEPLPLGTSGAPVEAVLATPAALVPADLSVVVTAGRAYDIPAFVDRVSGHGWPWWVRTNARSDLPSRDQRGTETALREQVTAHLPRPGTRWKGRGQVFKAAGWRSARVVGLRASGHREPLVGLTDLPARWEVLPVYERRDWSEPGFRAEKTAGWQGELPEPNARA